MRQDEGGKMISGPTAATAASHKAAHTHTHTHTHKLYLSHQYIRRPELQQDSPGLLQHRLMMDHTLIYHPFWSLQVIFISLAAQVFISHFYLQVLLGSFSMHLVSNSDISVIFIITVRETETKQTRKKEHTWEGECVLLPLRGCIKHCLILNFRLEVLILFLSMSCNFIFLLHYISEAKYCTF